MNTSGEAADQVVRMSLEVGEAALKISGAGAKQLAVLLYAILKEQKKTRGRARLETLVRSGRPLTVFSVKEVICVNLCRRQNDMESYTVRCGIQEEAAMGW